jgi:integrase
VLNLHLARAYLTASDPAFVERTWQTVMEQLQSRGKDSSRERYASVFKSSCFDALRHKKLLETTADDFFAVFKDGKVSIVYFLKQLHNFALSLGWIALPVVAPYLWPKYEAKERRGITPDEQQSILAIEKKAEWKLFLELLWETGAAQGDAAAMTAEDVDWQSRTITYFRAKTGSRAQFTISKALETVLSHLPTTGALFPKLSTFTANDRANQSATAPHCEHQKTSITQNTPGCLGGTRGRHRAARQKNQGRRKKAEWRGYTLLRNVTSPEGADCPLGTPIARACRP